VYFEYGTSTGYGARSSSKNIGSGRSSQNVAISVSGLAAGTVYHVRVVASNAVGANGGADVTFATTGKPIVRTGAATGVASNSATLTATVDPNGHASSWYFQYGPTAAYGLQTPTRSSSSTSGARTVTETISGLNAGSIYHYRLVATNSVGTNTSSDAALTTAGPPLTLTTSSRTVVLSGGVMLSGKVSSGRPNESVIVYAQRLDAGSFAAVATVLTDAGGAFSLRVSPRIATTYKGVWNGSPSFTVTVGVRPAVSLRALGHRRFATHVTGARSFRGRIVQLQRHRLDGSWVTISRAHLNRSSNAIFRPLLRRGRTTLRVAISVNQAGSGYLAGFSRWVSVKR
jgi:hypothetical protein